MSTITLPNAISMLVNGVPFKAVKTAVKDKADRFWYSFTQYLPITSDRTDEEILSALDVKADWIDKVGDVHKSEPRQNSKTGKWSGGGNITRSYSGVDEASGYNVTATFTVIRKAGRPRVVQVNFKGLTPREARLSGEVDGELPTL